jgi:peroxiredoxin
MKSTPWTLALALALSAAALADAEEIKMKDGGKVSGTVMQRSGQHLVLRLNRADVESVDGQPLPPPVAAGAAAPAFEVVDLAGATRSLTGSKGKVTLLQFWATWCPYCRKDLDLLKGLQTKYQDQGFEILALSIDQDAKKLEEFVKTEALNYPIAHIAATPGLADRYENQGVPGYFLIDQEGKITQVWRGSLVAQQANVEEAITRLLSDKNDRSASTNVSDAFAATAGV